MSIAEMKLRVAERVSIIAESEGIRIVPTDVGNADRFARALQDGIDELCDRHLWEWMKVWVDVVLSPDGTSADCVDASPVRYKMPDGVYAVPDMTEIPVMEDGANAGWSAAVVSSQQMERYRASNALMTGVPRYVSFGQAIILNSTPSTPRNADGRPIFQMQVYPIPSKAWRLRFPVYRRPARIVADNGPVMWPACHDHTVIAFATLAFMRVDATAESQMLINAQAEAERRLALSLENDARASNEPIGLSNPSSSRVLNLATALDYEGVRIN